MEILFVKKIPLQDLLSSLNAVISTNDSTEFMTGHANYNLGYIYKFQLKTTINQTTKISNNLNFDPDFSILFCMYARR